MSSFTTILQTGVAEAITLKGGLCCEQGGPLSQWADLPVAHKLGLLLGNPTAYLLFSFTDFAERKEWMTNLLRAALPQIKVLLDRRATLIREHYPETSV